jgi:hypothetical protein
LSPPDFADTSIRHGSLKIHEFGDRFAHLVTAICNSFRLSNARQSPAAFSTSVGRPSSMYRERSLSNRITTPSRCKSIDQLPNAEASYSEAETCQLPARSSAKNGPASFSTSTGNLKPLPSHSNWQGIDTQFGGAGINLADPLSEYRNAQFIQRAALASQANVVVFPETSVHRWNSSTDLFWGPQLRLLQKRGKTLLPHRSGCFNPWGDRLQQRRHHSW